MLKDDEEREQQPHQPAWNLSGEKIHVATPRASVTPVKTTPLPVTASVSAVRRRAQAVARLRQHSYPAEDVDAVVDADADPEGGYGQVSTFSPISSMAMTGVARSVTQGRAAG